jgi:serine O-acetyltransferase
MHEAPGHSFGVVSTGALGQVRPEQLQRLKRRVKRLWLFSPERLWLLSIRLLSRGHWVLAFWVKQLNTFLYHNSLAPGASVSPDISLGHNSIGIVISGNVEIGRGVHVWHNATLTGGRRERSRAKPSGDGSSSEAGDRPRQTPTGPRSRIIVEDHVKIGAGSVVIPPRGHTLRIGRGASIGAGTVVTEDVPPGATVVGQRPRTLLKGAGGQSGEERSGEEPAAAGGLHGGESPEPARGVEGER